MSVIKICGVVLIFLIFAITLPKSNGNLRVSVGICLCLLILLSGIESIKSIFQYTEELSSNYTLVGKYAPLLLKTLGIGLVCSAMSGMCRENGENSVASCVEFFGKGEILVCALPLFRDILTLAMESGA